MHIQSLFFLVLGSAVLCTHLKTDDFIELELRPSYHLEERIEPEYKFTIEQKKQTCENACSAGTSISDTLGWARATVSTLDLGLLLWVVIFFSVMCRDFVGYRNVFVYILQGFSFFELTLAIAILIFWPRSDTKDILKTNDAAFAGAILTVIKMVPLLQMNDANFIDFHDLCFSDTKAKFVEEILPILFVILPTLVHAAIALSALFVYRIRPEYERID